jgi:hypothetical protein
MQIGHCGSGAGFQSGHAGWTVFRRLPIVCKTWSPKQLQGIVNKTDPCLMSNAGRLYIYISALAALVKSITDQRMSPPIDTFLFMSSWKSLIMLISLSGHSYICRIFHNVCLSTASKAFEKCIRKPHQVASVAWSPFLGVVAWWISYLLLIYRFGNHTDFQVRNNFSNIFPAGDSWEMPRWFPQ